jgi:hypothetical protein
MHGGGAALFFETLTGQLSQDHLHNREGGFMVKNTLLYGIQWLADFREFTVFGGYTKATATAMAVLTQQTANSQTSSVEGGLQKKQSTH